jgi:hypothetical protein
MLYTSLIWMWGHPEVYILVLPAFGVFGEVVSTFSRKPIASYATAVLGMIGVSALALSVWLHHFFTMGAGADVNAFFGLMTMIIAIPTAVLMYTWIATMYKGRIRFTTPMLWFLGFVMDLYHRWPERRNAGYPTGGLPAPQQLVPGGPLPLQRGRRRAVRHLCRHQFLVPEVRRLQAQ